MKFKLDWGWGIAIFLLIFVGSVAWRIFIASQQQINLVTPEYYPKGIAYEVEIQKKANYEALNHKLVVKQNADSLFVTVPSRIKNKIMSGQILIYRPSNFEDDSLILFEFKDSLNTLGMSKSFMKKGVYEVQVDWQQDSVLFYGEESVYINK